MQTVIKLLSALSLLGTFLLLGSREAELTTIEVRHSPFIFHPSSLTPHLSSLIPCPSSIPCLSSFAFRHLTVPIQLRLSNVRDTTFTVSWLTGFRETGHIRYGREPGTLDRTAYDLRGTTYQGYTHYVIVSELQPQTTYYYDVISGGTTDNNDGAHYQMTTGPDLAIPAPYLVFGQVLRADGRPATGSLVYLTLRDNDGRGTPGESALLSALVDQDGYWSQSLSNARSRDLRDLFVFSPTTDQLQIEAEGGPDGAASRTVRPGDPIQGNPLLTITLPGGAWPTPIPTTPPAATATPTITPPPPEPTATPTSTVTPSDTPAPTPSPASTETELSPTPTIAMTATPGQLPAPTATFAGQESPTSTVLPTAAATLTGPSPTLPTTATPTSTFPAPNATSTLTPIVTWNVERETPTPSPSPRGTEQPVPTLPPSAPTSITTPPSWAGWFLLIIGAILILAALILFWRLAKNNH